MKTAKQEQPAPTLDTTREFQNEFEAAALLNVPVSTLRLWRRNGNGPSFSKLGRAVRYPRAGLIEFANKRTKTSTTA